jgi:hypothetical protein
MAPVLEKIVITTILKGGGKGETLKLFERTEWRWNETDGSQTIGETRQSWLESPEKGLTARQLTQ